MLLFSLLGNEPPPWHTWAIPAAGLVAALLTLFAGRLLVRSRRRGRPVPVEGPVHDPFEYGSRTEQRGSVRRKGVPIEILIRDAEAAQEPVRGLVIDRSMGGLCLLLHEESAPGTVFDVQPRQAPPGTPWVRVEVCSCKKDQSGYEVGCRFVRTPPWAVLLLFG